MLTENTQFLQSPSTAKGWRFAAYTPALEPFSTLRALRLPRARWARARGPAPPGSAAAQLAVTAAAESSVMHLRLGAFDWEWQSADGSMRKARLGDLVVPNPTDRGKPGTKRSVIVEADGGPLYGVLRAEGRMKHGERALLQTA